MTAAPMDKTLTLTRGDLTGFPRPVQNALLAAHRKGAGYRMTDSQHIILRGSVAGRDGSLKVSAARKAEDSVRFIEKWVKANYPATEKTRTSLTVIQSTDEPVLRDLPRGFTLFRNKRTKVENPLIGTNGKVFLCRVCGESMDTAVGASAHTRNAHDKGQDMTTEGEGEATVETTEPEAKPKITIEYQPPADKPFDDLVADAEKQVPIEWQPEADDPRVMEAIGLLLAVASDDLKGVVTDLEAKNADLQARLDECEARLALVRESLGM